MKNKKKIYKISIFLTVIVIFTTIWVLFISRQNRKSILDSSIILPTLNPTIYLSPTPYPDIGKKCSDGNQCLSSWCVDWKCSELKIYTFGPGPSQEPSKIIINGKSFFVYNYDYDSYTIYIGKDDGSPEHKLLKERLCPSRRIRNDYYPKTTCIEDYDLKK